MPLWAYEELIDFYEMDEANLDKEELPTERYRDHPDPHTAGVAPLRLSGGATPSRSAQAGESVSAGEGRDAANEPNLRCPECGYEMWTEMRGTPGVEFTFLWFCPLDHHAMIRKDALGEIEAAHRDGSETFEEYVKQEHVLGVIEAEVPREES